MVIDKLFEYAKNPIGIIHVGAHYAEEYFVYVKYNRHNILMFEPLPEACSIARKIARTARVERLALGAYNGNVILNVAPKHDASSSILEPKVHLEQYPDIVFTRNLLVQQVTLDYFMCLNYLERKFDTLVMDAQGYELEVLTGAIDTLRDIDWIYTEVNRAELYFGCAMIDEMDEFLFVNGFTRVELEWKEDTWGNAIYCRTGKINLHSNPGSILV